MYHVGIVEHIISPKHKGVISADDTVQAVVRMWDENLLILPVHKKIVRKVKKGNYVLNDYTPMSPTSRYRNLVVVKVLPDKDGKRIWEDFKGELDRRKVVIKKMHEEKMESTAPPIRYIR